MAAAAAPVHCKQQHTVDWAIFKFASLSEVHEKRDVVRGGRERLKEK